MGVEVRVRAPLGDLGLGAVGEHSGEGLEDKVGEELLFSAVGSGVSRLVTSR